MNFKLFFITILSTLFFVTKSQTGWQELGASSNTLNTFKDLNNLICNGAGGVYYTTSVSNAITAKRFIAKWDWSTWNRIISPDTTVLLKILCLTKDANDNMYAAGWCVNNKPHIYKYNGQLWEDLGIMPNNTNGNYNTFFAMCTDNDGNIYAAGNCKNSIGNGFVAKWDGLTWTELGNGININLNTFISTLCADNAGNIYAGGSFKNSAGARYVAKWDGTNWSELGTGTSALLANGDIFKITSDNAGNVYAGGTFQNDSSYTYVAKWNGINWTELRGFGNRLSRTQDAINSIIVNDSGIVYAAGDFANNIGKRFVARWDGIKWTDFGNLNANAEINSLCFDPGGNLYAGGRFTNSNNKLYVAKYGNRPFLKVASNTKNLSELSIYPNPFQNSFHVKTSFKANVTNAQLLMYNVLGEVVFSKNFTSQAIEIDEEVITGNLKTGLYTLQLITPEGNISKKIIVAER